MTVKIVVSKKGEVGGSLKVYGDFEIVDAEGKVIEHKGGEAHLCRCGQSANKPFCDGSHAKAGFKG
jgi:CDGSH-type Zn-finger protein